MSDLLRELGPQKDQLINVMNLRELAETISYAQVRDFRGIAVLIGQLGQRRNELIGALNLGTLATTAGHAQPEDDRGITDLQRELAKQLG